VSASYRFVYTISKAPSQ